MNVVKECGARRLLPLSVTAVIGLAIGVSLSGAKANACECAQPRWDLRLRSATSTDPTTTHEAFWPSVASLEVSSEITFIEADKYSESTVAYVRAGDW